MTDSQLGRLLDPKTRRIGVDKEALDQQVLETQQKRAHEKAELHAEAERLCELDQLARNIEARKASDRRQSLRELNDFNLSKMSKEGRRTLPASDPFSSAYAHHTSPPSLLGPASLQVFAGEDTNYHSRMQTQRTSLLASLDAQIDEKRQNSENVGPIRYSSTDKNASFETSKATQDENRRCKARAVMLENQAAAQEKIRIRAQEKSQELHWNNRDISENLSRFPHRPHPVLSAEEKEIILETVAVQRFDRDQSKREEQTRAQENEKRHSAAIYAAMESAENKGLRRRRELELEVSEFNRGLIKERVETARKNTTSEGIDFDHGFFAGFGRR